VSHDRTESAPHRLTFRESVQPGDVEAVRRIVEATGFFSAEEVAIAAELVQERLDKVKPAGTSSSSRNRAGS